MSRDIGDSSLLSRDIGDSCARSDVIRGEGLGPEFVGADVADSGNGPVRFSDEGASVVEELEGLVVVEDVGGLVGVLTADEELDPAGSDRAVAFDLRGPGAGGRWHPAVELALAGCFDA